MTSNETSKAGETSLFFSHDFWNTLYYINHVDVVYEWIVTNARNEPVVSLIETSDNGKSLQEGSM